MRRSSSSGSDGRVPPMQTFDTAVLIAHMDSKDPRYEKANEYVFDIGPERPLRPVGHPARAHARSVLCPSCQYIESRRSSPT